MYPEISIGPINIESYLFFYLLAFIVVAIFLSREFARRQYPRKLFIGLFMTGLVFGLIGSKIYFILNNWDIFVMNRSRILFDISGSGWYGGLILGVSAIIIFLKIKKLPILKFMDILIPFVPVGQVFGRLGCFFAGCCHGTPSNLPWAVVFPNGLYPPHVKVHPTQLYEMIICLIISIILFRYKKKNMKDGKLLGLYLVLAGMGRFIIEFYRPNPKIIAHLTTPQILAFIGILLGGYFIFRVKQSVNVFSKITEEQHKSLYS
jgi:phosphatidylglycerol:prolipoprotein diacylglycerol transferase